MTLDSANTPKGTILVIDDSPDNLRVLSTTLAERGYKIRCVTNGEMALVSINHLPPDLILLDIRMPVIDGYEVCRRLKAKPETKDIPIIFLSAADDLAGKVKAFEMGGVDYITKPFQTEEVLVRIANQLTIQQLQKQLVERNRRLQHEIDEHKQTEAALQDAKEAAEAANYAKSEFLAKMSHELRTPLNAILGFAELMRGDGLLSSEYQDYLAGISQSGQQLLKLLNHILTVISTESDKISLNEHPFDLYRLLNAIASAWQPKVAAKRLQLVVDCDSSVPRYICTDESKLRQVLMNLLENAIQFTHQGQVTLRVKQELGHIAVQPSANQSSNSTGQPQGYGSAAELASVPLFFEIEDTGSGIAAHEMNHLFQVFSQTETGRKAERGVGLGLFMSRQFVQILGGEITIASTPGQGTSVRFYILVHLVHPEVVLDWQQANASSADCAIAPSYTFTAEPQPSFTAEQLLESMRQGVSADWLTQLHQAAIKGADHQILQLIQAIPASHAPLAKVLTDWNRNFEFDQIVTITQQALE